MTCRGPEEDQIAVSRGHFYASGDLRPKIVQIDRPSFTLFALDDPVVTCNFRPWTDPHRSFCFWRSAQATMFQRTHFLRV